MVLSGAMSVVMDEVDMLLAILYYGPIGLKAKLNFIFDAFFSSDADSCPLDLLISNLVQRR